MSIEINSSLLRTSPANTLDPDSRHSKIINTHRYISHMSESDTKSSKLQRAFEYWLATDHNPLAEAECELPRWTEGVKDADPEYLVFLAIAWQPAIDATPALAEERLIQATRFLSSALDQDVSLRDHTAVQSADYWCLEHMKLSFLDAVKRSGPDDVARNVFLKQHQIVSAFQKSLASRPV